MVSELFWDGIKKSLNLTDHGLLKLQVFPEIVVSQYYRELQKTSGIRDKIRWLIDKCDNHCKLNGIRAQWNKYFDYSRTLNIDKNSPLSTHVVPVVKPACSKQPEIYSTRDLTNYKITPTPEMVKKGLIAIGNMIPSNILIEINQWLELQEDIVSN